MATDPFITISLLAGLAIAAFAGWMAWRNLSEVRFDRVGYYGDRHRVPRFTVCPNCRQRSYAQRDLRERYCEPCDLHYGTTQSAPAGAMPLGQGSR